MELDEPPDETVGLATMESPTWPKRLRSSMTFPPIEKPNDPAGPDSDRFDPLTVADVFR